MAKSKQGKNEGKKFGGAHSASLRELLSIAKKLRSPTGCPWDRKKTIENLLPDLLGEVKEVEEAIQKGDMKNLKEELGDVLFNMVLLCVIAEEEGKFTMDEVLKEIAEKIVSRHTWVFGKDKASTPEEALALWGKNKAKERKSKGRMKNQ
ncbi:MAG: MazG nucleotide pyrophosphohydrolase domain-containing protein [Candidatus Gracilibacteria bacterium]